MKITQARGVVSLQKGKRGSGGRVLSREQGTRIRDQGTFSMKIIQVRGVVSLQKGKRGSGEGF
jgi:hypothetical protein